MSLPRSNYDPRRVCLNPFPNFALGKYRRTIGIYLAGGLVRTYRTRSLPASYSCVNLHVPLLASHGIDLCSSKTIVCPCQLDILGCCYPIGTCPHNLRRPTRPCSFRRLGPRNLFPPRYASSQPHRQGPCTGRRRVPRSQGCMEGTAVFVHRFCFDGRRSRRQCRAFSLNR